MLDEKTMVAETADRKDAAAERPDAGLPENGRKSE